MIPISIKGKADINQKLTVDALLYYAPLYQEALEAEKRLDESFDELSDDEINVLKCVADKREMIVDRVAYLAYPLIHREIDKLIRNSHLPYSDELFKEMFFSAYDGVSKGLSKIDVSKLKSPTNYIFQWIYSYLNSELSLHETPQGIAPSRFGRIKKIAAVRAKLSNELNREATNKEVLEYFHSGRANIKSMHGRLQEKRYISNHSMTMAHIKEQEIVSRNLSDVSLNHNGVDEGNDKSLSYEDKTLPSMIIRSFIDSSNLTETARLVLISEYTNDDLTKDELQAINELSDTQYRSVAHQLRTLLRDRKGVFHQFLQENESDPEILDILGKVPTSERSKSQLRYFQLFTDNKPSLRRGR